MYLMSTSYNTYLSLSNVDILPPSVLASLQTSRNYCLSLISDCIYYSLIFGGTDRSASELFDSVADSEMLHFRLLGGIICSAGGDPSVNTRLYRGEGRLSSKGDAHFVRRAIEDVSSRLQRTESELQRIASRCSVGERRDMILMIADNRERNIRILSNYLDDCIG